MARLNMKATTPQQYTHGGAPAYNHLTPIQQLRRSVLSCMLWEDEFYEDGQTIAQRIEETAIKCRPEEVSRLCTEARHRFNLRHVPLLLLCSLISMARGYSIVSETIAVTIGRADELTELLAVYWRNGRKPLSTQLKKGLAQAFTKFSPYSLAKYNRDNAIKLRDVLFLCHAKPKDADQAATWKKLVEGTLESPDTWEVNLSTGANKKETFERLIQSNELGYLALLRNLRNMEQAGCDKLMVREAIEARKNGADKVFPFRFIAAAKAAPTFEESLDKALLANCTQSPKLPGKTIVVVDVSGSMYGHGNISVKSDMNRALAACALAAIAREMCEDSAIYATGGSDMKRIHATKEVPSRHGMALVDAIHNMKNDLGGGGIFLNQAMNFIAAKEHFADRTIVITDEQDCSGGGDDSPANANPLGKGYLINIATNKNGIAYGPKWTHFDGLSEQVLRYIQEIEQEPVFVSSQLSEMG